MMTSDDKKYYITALKDLSNTVHQIHLKWWNDLKTGEPIDRNVGEMLMLMVSELSEGMEGHRKSLMDTHLPHRPMLEVELADVIIRALDMGGGLHLDVPGALVEKLLFNSTRTDHTVEHRLSEHGKKY